MPYNEADTRAKLIDPALHTAGWTEDYIRREETAPEIEITSSGSARRRMAGKVDYTLRIKASPTAQPVAVALIEAKAENYPATHGLQQAKLYASTKRLNVPFVYSSNGHQFVEYDSFTGLTHAPRPLSEFPPPEELRERYEKGKGFSLDSEGASPLLTPYPRGEAIRRYYQDAAIRATLEKIATGQNRALLSLATGSGKTFIAVNLLKRIADAGQLRRALFVCDRDELRRQALAAFQEEFGGDAAAATTSNPEKNARVVVATYQTLGVDRDDSDSSYLKTHYPENYFSHIVIDECHRSARGKWSEVLTRNSDAVQIGLTATPREFERTENTDAAREDERISAKNSRTAYQARPSGSSTKTCYHISTNSGTAQTPHQGRWSLAKSFPAYRIPVWTPRETSWTCWTGLTTYATRQPTRPTYSPCPRHTRVCCSAWARRTTMAVSSSPDRKAQHLARQHAHPQRVLRRPVRGRARPV